MTRFRALVVAGSMSLALFFGGCFDFGGGDDCQPISAPAGPVICGEV